MRSKIDYYQQIANKINRINDSSQWLQLVNEIRNRQYQICCNVSVLSFKEYFDHLLNPPQTEVNIYYAPIF